MTYSQRAPADGKIDNLPSSPLPDSALRYRQELMKSMNKRLADAGKANRAQPVFFMARWCGYCKQAKGYLAEKGIRYGWVTANAICLRIPQEDRERRPEAL